MLVTHADKVILDGNGRTDDQMADEADDFGIPIKPSRPKAAMPPPAADLFRSNAEPARTRVSRRKQTDRSVGSRDNEVDAGTLIVGPKISFSGEITSCHRLIIEGSVEANLQDCRDLIIAESGVFTGFGKTEIADIRGHFDGDFVVRKRLIIRASGHVSGRIAYGEVEIESGGKISGDIRALGSDEMRRAIDVPREEEHGYTEPPEQDAVVTPLSTTERPPISYRSMSSRQGDAA
jgi:cytoskeletal protein CcmA (bactofilin family)